MVEHVIVGPHAPVLGQDEAQEIGAGLRLGAGEHRAEPPHEDEVIAKVRQVVERLPLEHPSGEPVIVRLPGDDAEERLPMALDQLRRLAGDPLAQDEQRIELPVFQPPLVAVGRKPP